LFCLAIINLLLKIMTDNHQSIEDLIAASQGEPVDDESAQAKFSVKQKEVEIKQLEKLTKQQADDMGLPYVDLSGFPISPEALSLIEEAEARQAQAVCFFYDGEGFRMATVYSQVAASEKILNRLSERLHCPGKIYLISKYSLAKALELYKIIPKHREIIKGVKVTADDLNKYSEKFTSFKDLQAEIDQAQITEIVTMIMAAAIKADVSDVHIEGEEREIKVRFRIDGVLHDVAILDKNRWDKIISRLKLLTSVKINITDKPQDGRMAIFMTNDRVDIRVSFLPTSYGESVVMRFLRASKAGLDLENLGIRGGVFEQLKKEIARPNGMIITTGPTGSGKTTTLYAILKKLNSPQTKIITIEDPIEYQLEGINQSQTSDKYTFAHGLRSIVRQDPDVILVGEIRDLETAEIAIQAALTGHLVLSTIHTNDAAGTVPRFLSMGVKPFLLAPALNAMIGQRLVRQICDKCKKEVKLSEENLTKVKEILEKLPNEKKSKIDFDNLKFYKGEGCEACQGIGYKGRIGIYEIMLMNEEIEKLILSGNVSEYDMRNISVKHGMVTMVQDGLLKALDGLTSINEVFRVSE